MGSEKPVLLSSVLNLHMALLGCQKKIYNFVAVHSHLLCGRKRKFNEALISTQNGPFRPVSKRVLNTLLYKGWNVVRYRRYTYVANSLGSHLLLRSLWPCRLHISISQDTDPCGVCKHQAYYNRPCWDRENCC